MPIRIRACGNSASLWSQLSALILLTASGTATAQETQSTTVKVCTDRGSFAIALDEARAPRHVENFLEYVRSGYYGGTVFHRAVSGRLVQGGGYDRNLKRRPWREPIVNESGNGLRNERGSLAAARLDDPDSATSQFFINLEDNRELDGADDEPGYTVFGQVTTGMEVLEAIADLPTGSRGDLPGDVPDPLVTIWSMNVGAFAPEEPAELESQRRQLRIELVDARAREDFGRVLDIIDHLSASCSKPDPDLLALEAEAALARGQAPRARYRLEDYFAIADPSQGKFGLAQRLYRSLPSEHRQGVGPLLAHCRMPAVPEVPDGRSSELDAMIETQDAMHRFMDSSNAYLDCVSQVIDEGGLSETQEVAAVELHNDMVERMEDLAEKFNREVRAFKARQ